MKNVYLEDFLYSHEYTDWQKTSGKSLGYSKFVQGAKMCKCIVEPELRYCVDQIEVGVGESLYALKMKLRSSDKCKCDFCVEEATKKVAQGQGNI
jgi:hypothetical protein